jgi:hypothetical protein
MKVLDELKLALNRLGLSFSPAEVKIAFGVLNEIDKELGLFGAGPDSWRKIGDASGPWNYIRPKLVRYLVLNTDSFLAASRENKREPEELVFAVAYGLLQPFKELSDGVRSGDFIDEYQARDWQALDKYVSDKWRLSLKKS